MRDTDHDTPESTLTARDRSDAADRADEPRPRAVPERARVFAGRQHAAEAAMSDGGPVAQEPMMTAEEVADFLRISLSMVYKLRREGALPGIAVGALWRFHPEHVRAFSRGDLSGTGQGSPVVPISGRRRRV